jgi:exodeoxyribonuclease VII small subunit
MTDAPKTDVASLPFEAALKELEAIVTDLERGQIPLDQSIALYERGEALKKRCADLLTDAERRVEKIRTDAQGRAAGTEPLDA